MDAIRIRQDLHQLIDTISDTQILQEFYNIISDYSQKSDKTDILDELTEQQKLVLNESIEQYKRNETLENEEVKANTKKWLEE